MKKIRVLTNHVLILNKMTVAKGQEIEVWNEEVLESNEVKNALQAKQVEILDDRDKPVD
jgi:hypothetical protein